MAGFDMSDQTIPLSELRKTLVAAVEDAGEENIQGAI
jgi:hypothetical protein